MRSPQPTSWNRNRFHSSRNLRTYDARMINFHNRLCCRDRCAYAHMYECVYVYECVSVCVYLCVTRNECIGMLLYRLLYTVPWRRLQNHHYGRPSLSLSLSLSLCVATRADGVERTMLTVAENASFSSTTSSSLLSSSLLSSSCSRASIFERVSE